MNVDFSKASDGLVPAIIQDHLTGKVLMLGYMNAEALEKTQKEKRVTFFSRSKQRLWTKGEESGNFLDRKSTRMNSSHVRISYAVFCLKKKISYIYQVRQSTIKFLSCFVHL